MPAPSRVPLPVPRDRFLARAARDADRLESLAGPPGPDGEGVAEIERLAHGLAGAGGSFGFPGISAAADVVEREASRLREARAAGSDLLAEACRALVAALRRPEARS